MIYRRFGKTELQLPVLSAGFMRAMHSWKDLPDKDIPETSQKKLETVVERAFDLGINHFETARGYGTSEKQLGKALRKYERNSYVVQTKVPPSDDPNAFRKEFEQSLDHLGLEHVDLLAIHGINDYRSFWQVCRENGCLNVTRKLQDEGMVGHVGFSGHGPPEVILEALRHEQDGGFDYLNIHWYYINQVNCAVLDEAASKDLGVFIISPTDKGGMLQNPPKKLKTLCQPLSPMQFNDLYCLSRPDVHTISVGASHSADFNEHVTAVDLLDTSHELVSAIDRQLREAMLKETGSARPEGLWEKFPPWLETPGYINIRFILWLYNLARGWDLVEYGRSRYRKLGVQPEWVPGNNAALAGQFDFGPVAENSGMREDVLLKQLKSAHKLLA